MTVYGGKFFTGFDSSQKILRKERPMGRRPGNGMKLWKTIKKLIHIRNIPPEI